MADEIEGIDEFLSPEDIALYERLKASGAYGKPNGPGEDCEPSNVVQLRIVAREGSDTAAAEGKALLTTINPANWEGLPIPEREWCVPDYIPANTVTMLSGDGGQGKSLLALQLAVGRALSREWIGLLPEPGRTLVLSAEDDADEMHRRLDDIRKFYSASWVELSDIRLVDLVGADTILGELIKGQIKPTKMYDALDAYMVDFKPSLVTLDVLADMFGGDECIRAQVRQFINLLKGLARKHHCAILLLSHPSLTGMNTGTGLSGSTDWHNAVRSRAYLQTPRTEEGATPNINLRTFQGMKSNYGERGGKFDLVWETGVFRRVAGPSGFDKMAAEATADDTFLRLMALFKAQGREVSPNKSPSYAPAVFSKHPDACGISSAAFSAAMERLLRAGKIKIETFGPPSHERKRLVLGEAADD
jgi:RecA-family ATPase